MDNTTFDGMGEAQALVVVGISAVLVVLSIAVYVAIIRKAGYSGWWVLTMFVPVLNIVMLVVFAFAEWPVTRELRAARAIAEQQQQIQSANRFSWGS